MGTKAEEAVPTSGKSGSVPYMNTGEKVKTRKFQQDVKPRDEQ